MSDNEKPETGTSEGTHAAGADPIAANLQQLAAQIDQGGGEQLDLIDGSPDLLDLDGLAQAANSVATQRRARGRPAGSANKRNTQVFEYLEALGHRDPAVTLSMIQTADTKALAKALGVDTPKGRLAVLSVQRQAASDLLPYKYAKKPQAVELPPGVRPLMQIGDFNLLQVQGDVHMSADPAGAGRAEKANEINGEIVRQTSDESHGSAKANDPNDLDVSSN
jgi:hypothetical protein